MLPLKPVNYQHILRDVATAMVRLRKPERLVKIITRLIDRELELTHASILLFEEKKERYIFVDSKGKRKIPTGLVKIDAQHPLIRWFLERRHKKAEKRDHLYVVDFQRIKTQAALSQAFEMDAILKSLSMFKAELVIPSYFKNQLQGLLMLGKKINGKFFTQAEIAFLHVLAQDCSMAIKNAEFNQNLIEQNERLREKIEEVEKFRKKEHDTYYEIMRSLAEQVYVKDAYTFGHIHQVERLGIMTAKELGYDLSGKGKDILSAGLILHDVGKIGIPDHILKKTSKLEPDEWAIMKTHAEKGAEILKHLSAFKEVANIVLSHHENFDGTGYPRGLRGEEIPIEARIVSVVDAFHAIVSTRCYSKGRPVEYAFEELERCAGKQFDPQVVIAFIRAMKQDMKKRGVAFYEEHPQEKSA